MKLFKLINKSVARRTNSNLDAMPTASLAIALTTLSGLFSILPAIAETKTIESIVLFQPPPESEQPESTEGAASRQSRVCASDLKETAQSDDLKLSSIVPQTNFGLTTAQRPTFWVYIPETSARQAILSIKQEGNAPHWQQSVNLQGKAGITGIKLADDAPALELGENYQWAIILVCGDRPNPNDPVDTAWIKRVEPAEDSDLTAIESLAKAATSAKQGIWYDALDILAAQTSVDNWQVWTEYLKSGGLERIANEPVILD